MTRPATAVVYLHVLADVPSAEIQTEMLTRLRDTSAMSGWAIDEVRVADPGDEPVTRAELDQNGCQWPGCDHAAHKGDPLALHAACHIDAGTRVMYQNGTLSVCCDECGALIARIAVA